VLGIFRNALRKSAYGGFRAVFWGRLWMVGHRRIYLIDLDNTLADTWPHLKTAVQGLGNPAFVAGLKPLPGVCRFVRGLCRKGRAVFIVSARPIGVYRATRRWLATQGIEVYRGGLILVNGPDEKVWFLRKIVSQGKEAVLIDDLSFNHENGEVRFYSETIANVRNLGVRHYGYEEIKRLNQRCR
jgi:hypothetical protein